MRKKNKNYLGRNLSKVREDDKISSETRSAIMSKIRSSGTKLEVAFTEELITATEKPFSLNVREVKGKPDVVFFDDKICIFIDSDFWHGWQYPRWKKLLKNDQWRMKIEKNRRRDKNTTQYLRRKGWHVVRIWEHNIKKNIQKEIQRVLSFFVE